MDGDHVRIGVDRVDDAVVTTASSVKSGELEQ
jgi:hypothetical protein